MLSLGQKESELIGRLPARQITLEGPVAYIASGKEINAVDHVRFAEVFRVEKTRNQYLKLKNDLLNHPYLLRSRRLAEQTRKLAEMRSKLRELAEEAKQRGAEYQALQREVADLQRNLDGLKEQQERLAADYRTARLTAESMIGVKWRVPTPHDSALILCGTTLVAGGEGNVLALDADTGRIQQKLEVDGEASGLAFSDGYLLVSTTTGKVYCFGDASTEPQQVVRNLGRQSGPPYPADDLSAMYAAAAEAILSESGVRRGYCLVLGSEKGRLAYELARRSQLNIYCVEPDASKVEASRKALRAVGLYGPRVTVEQTDPTRLAYPNYFANLVVSETLLKTGNVPGDPQQVARHVKPVGGVICLGSPTTAPGSDRASARQGAHQWLLETGLTHEGAEIEHRGEWILLTRGKLPGAGSWTHQYANPSNTATGAVCAED